MTTNSHIPTVQTLLSELDVVAYARTRNFNSGKVSHLGKYISRGVISIREVYRYVKRSGVSWTQAEKFVQELAWREYWQRQWFQRGDGIFSDIRSPQHPVVSQEMPTAVVDAQTGITAIDTAIRALYETGYMHNHMRMYVAAVVCNLAQCHWHTASKWLYAHLLDGDLASNALSWQWVAGTNSHKKYVANQDNVNTYFDTDQKNTFLDKPYADLQVSPIPQVLSSTTHPQFDALPWDLLPKPELNPNQPTCVYTYYHIDPSWHASENFQRVFLLSPSHFETYPINTRCFEFAMDLARKIPGMQFFVGTYNDLCKRIPSHLLHHKSHPLSQHFTGIAEPADTLVPHDVPAKSFFSFWKKSIPFLKW